MKIEGNAGILKIYVGESDKINGRPLYEEIVFEARKEGLAGATVIKGVMSFGASHSIHTIKIFALSGDLPIVVEIIDSMEKLRKFSEIVDRMLDAGKKGGLMILTPVEVMKYQPGEKYRNPSKP
jgi:uncharacterized protein